ncbi:actin cytoskeleton organization protein [Phellopilus nigrolimitatus]|nr:actin cytoskeleton organization protein [Phellopilus nigrolimitatus]
MSQVALERQIRLIYNAIDAGSAGMDKSALQQCNKLLKKHPSNDLVKVRIFHHGNRITLENEGSSGNLQALKALAIVRMNRIEECLPICDEVLASKPTDLETLNVMMLVLRALGRHTDLATMFDEAYRTQPENEELGMQDFFANIRTGNWKTAQQIAQRLHKAFGAGGADRFLYWAVLSTVLQANDPATPPAMRAILQKLAHRLLGTVTVPPYATADRLHVHISVLTALSLNDEAAALLDSEEGRAIAKTSLVVDELRRDLVRARGDFTAEGDRARAKLVEENDRNWLEFLAVLDATFAAPADADKVRDVRGLFRQLADADGRRDRGALLALLELEKRARENGFGSDFESQDGLLGLIKLYFERFGDKACCFEDLKPYTVLEGSELLALNAYLDAHTHVSDTEPTLYRSINVHKLRRHVLGADELSVTQETERALAYLRAYTAALGLGGALPETELQPADDLVLLAAQTFVGLWGTQNDVAWLYMAVSVLEYAARRSKNSYLVRLHLVRVHRLLSAPSLALQHYRAMRVKQVQNDTLSHFVLARAATFSLAAGGDLTLTQECVEASQIYATNSSETSEFIVRAFASEKYSQVTDLIAFEDRLDNSLQRDLVKIEHVRMRLAHEGPSTELADTELIELKFIFDRIHYDNRDFEVLPNYQPRGQPTFDAQTLMMNSPGLGWLSTFLRIYIRVFLLASDIDETVEEKLLIGDRPKVADIPENKIPLKERIHVRKEAELNELTADERTLFDYVSALCDWLGPYHDHARPQPEAVLAEVNRQQETLRGNNAKGAPKANGSPSPPTNGQKRHAEEPPAVRDPPEGVPEFFDSMAARFKEVSGEDRLPWEALHVATLTQEAALMLALASVRFKAPAVVKANKFGGLTVSLRALRQKASAVLKEMASGLGKIGAQASTSEKRRAFVDACRPIQEYPEFEHDSLMDVAKRLGDARKRVIEGVGKGIAKIATTQMQ